MHLLNIVFFTFRSLIMNTSNKAPIDLCFQLHPSLQSLKFYSNSILVESVSMLRVSSVIVESDWSYVICETEAPTSRSKSSSTSTVSSRSSS